jgi:hypothetical protein
VDVRIGVTYTAKELDLELAEDTEPEKLQSDIETALATDDGVLWLTDRKGRRVGVPVAKVAYVEISTRDDRHIGFGST